MPQQIQTDRHVIQHLPVSEAKNTLHTITKLVLCTSSLQKLLNI